MKWAVDTLVGWLFVPRLSCLINWVLTKKN